MSRIIHTGKRSRSDVAVIWALFWRSGGWRLVLGALLALLVVLAGMALLGTSGWFITATALAGLSAAALAGFNVFLPSAAIRLLALLRTFGRYGERMVTHDATFAVLAALRERLFRGWAQPQAARALLRRPARLLFRLTNDVDALDTIYLRLVVPVFAAMGAALLAGLVLGLIDWRLGLALLAWLLVCGVGTTWMVAQRARPLALRRARVLERLRSRSIDLVAGQTDLAMAGQLAIACENIARTDAALAQLDDALNRLDTRAGWGYAVAGHVAVAGVLVAVGLLASAGLIAAPAAALALLLALSALEPFAALRRGALDAGRSWLAARRLAPRLHADADTSEQAAPASGEVALALQDVSVTHPGRARAALDAISVRIEAGERVAVVGASGVGKSTLLSLASGEIQPQAGLVAAMRASWLTQRTELFQDSVRDNLRLARPGASDDELWQALDDAGLGATVRGLARQLDTQLGEGGLGLSGGQARRLALARLLLKRADFWLLDEPTEALDRATADEVLACLARHAQGRSLLLATHLRREAVLAERLIVLQDGRVALDARRGSPEFDAALATLRND